MSDRGGRADQNWWQRAVGSGLGQALRWLAVLGLVIWRWQAGRPPSFIGWVPVLVVGLLLLLPDAESVAFGGVKLEMRRTREEITGLRQQVTQLQIAHASSVGQMIGNDAIDAFLGISKRVREDEASGVAPRMAPAAGEPASGIVPPGEFAVADDAD
jgi:hypothetical protein